MLVELIKVKKHPAEGKLFLYQPSTIRRQLLRRAQFPLRQNPVSVPRFQRQRETIGHWFKRKIQWLTIEKPFHGQYWSILQNWIGVQAQHQSRDYFDELRLRSQQLVQLRILKFFWNHSDVFEQKQCVHGSILQFTRVLPLSFKKCHGGKMRTNHQHWWYQQSRRHFLRNVEHGQRSPESCSRLSWNFASSYLNLNLLGRRLSRNFALQDKYSHLAKIEPGIHLRHLRGSSSSAQTKIYFSASLQTNLRDIEWPKMISSWISM